MAAASAALALVATACAEPLRTDRCLPIYGVMVEVHDARTGQLIGGARGIVQDGPYVDSLRPLNEGGSILHGALNRSGRYAVSVRVDGYAPFDTAGVRVRSGECAVASSTVFAVNLEPQP